MSASGFGSVVSAGGAACIAGGNGAAALSGNAEMSGAACSAGGAVDSDCAIAGEERVDVGLASCAWVARDSTQTVIMTASPSLAGKFAWSGEKRRGDPEFFTAHR